MVIFDGLVLASIAYFAYKIYRFATKSCPVCVANPNQSFVFLILFCKYNPSHTQCVVPLSTLPLLSSGLLTRNNACPLHHHLYGHAQLWQRPSCRK